MIWYNLVFFLKIKKLNIIIQDNMFGLDYDNKNLDSNSTQIEIGLKKLNTN